MLKVPGDDPRLDPTDVFVFASTPPVDRINVDTDGDTQADAAFSFVFSNSNDGTQPARGRHRLAKRHYRWYRNFARSLRALSSASVTGFPPA
jgi:hypothetical protein